MGRGKRKYDAPLQPNGRAMYAPRTGGYLVPDSIDITAFGDPVRQYQTVSTGTSSNVRWTFDPPKETGVKATGGSDMPYGISGEFGGIHFTVEGLRYLEDNPIDEVVREVLGLNDGEELLVISYRTASGEVKVRPWNADE